LRNVFEGGLHCCERSLFPICLLFVLRLLLNLCYFLCRAALEDMILLKEFLLLASLVLLFRSLCRHSKAGQELQECKVERS